MERLAYVISQGPDISAFRAGNHKVHLRQFDAGDLEFVYGDGPRFYFDLDALSGLFIQRLAVDFDGRIDRRKLLQIAGKTLGGGVNHLIRNVLRREGGVDGLFGVVAGGGGAERDGASVGFVHTLQLLQALGPLAGADVEHAGRHGVQRAGVANLDLLYPQVLADGPADFIDDVKTCPTFRFVDEKQAAFLEGEGWSGRGGKHFDKR